MKKDPAVVRLHQSAGNHPGQLIFQKKQLSKKSKNIGVKKFGVRKKERLVYAKIVCKNIPSQKLTNK